MSKNLLKHQYKFDPNRLAGDTSDAYSSGSFTNWVDGPYSAQRKLDF